MKKSPKSQVSERFESKEKLVAAVQKLATDDLWLDRVNEAKGFEKISNAKLVRLHDILTSVKKEFGSRDKLIGAILESEKRQKDGGYKTRLEGYPLPRLLDHYRSAQRRAKRASAKPAPAKKATKKPAAKKSVKAKRASA
jgi:hypothetical protein